MRNEGNVLLLILVGIVLFGALTFAITQSEDNSDDNIDYERGLIGSAAILNYTTDLKRAMNRMSELNGCTPEEMSFEQHPYTDTNIYNEYPNSNSPADYSCHVFHPNGGGLTPLGGPSDLGGEFINYTGGCNVMGVGRHILFGVGGISREQCIELNKSVDYNAPTYEPSTPIWVCGGDNFIGTFPSVGSTSNISGKHRGCMEGFGDPGSTSHLIGGNRDRLTYYEIIHYRD